MRGWLALLTWIVVYGFESVAWADGLQGTRFELEEVQHRVRIRLDRGHATLFVERVVHNPGNRTDQAVYSLDLPWGAVATSLRTLGTSNGAPHWFSGELFEAEEAAARYRELTGIGGHYPKDPALLSWVNATNLYLQVFPCMPKANKAVGYSLEMPLYFERGRFWLQLPVLGTETVPALVSIETAHGADRVFIDDEPLSPGEQFRSTEERVVALRPAWAPGVQGALAVAPTGLGRTFAQAQFALTDPISKVPNDAYVVVLLDNSRSMAWRRSGMVTMAEATVRLFKNAQVQVVDFDRKPKARFKGFVAQSIARKSLQREIAGLNLPDAGNGSEVDRALAEAEKWLLTAPANRTKRILLFTDTLVPARIEPQDLVANVGASGALLHIVKLAGAGTAELSLVTPHAWEQVARGTGGLVWQANSSLGEGTGEGADNPYVRLVRPTELYNATFHIAGIDEDLGTLDEGDGFEHMGVFDGEVRQANLSGELWAMPFNLTLYPNEELGKVWSALVFGTQHREELREAEMMVLARRGNAVSPVTSFLAVEPGVRPSTDGLEWDGFGVGGVGTSGVGDGGGGAFASYAIGEEPPFDPEAFLADYLTHAWRRCNGTQGAASVTLETHFSEVADVSLSLDEEAPTQYQCLQEAGWALDLRRGRFRDERTTWTIEL